MGKVQRVPTHSLPQHRDSLPHHEHLPTICENGWTYIITQSPELALRFIPGGVRSVGLDSSLMTKVALMCSTTWTGFTAPKSLLVAPAHSSPGPPQPLATTVLFTVTTVLPFPERQVDGAVGWPFQLASSFNDRHLCFLRVFAWLSGAFFPTSLSPPWCLVFIMVIFTSPT